jgi:hypothetical protein
VNQWSTKKSALVLAGLAVFFVVFGAAGLYWFGRSGLTRPMDNMFGDQHLKTVVALVELHKTRYGSYPATLSEITFAGDWDQIAIGSVRYCASADRRTYFVEVIRGWMGQPALSMPSEFWRGTGFSAATGPCQ